MTPITRFFERFLPARWTIAAVALTYAVMLTAVIVLAGYPISRSIIYLDVHSVPNK